MTAPPFVPDESRAILKDYLGFIAPKADPEKLADSLLSSYGSVSSVLESHPDDLASSTGMTDAAAQTLALIPELTRYIAVDRLGKRPNVGRFSSASAYLATRYIGRPYEYYYILCLNAKGTLLSCALMNEGTIDSATVHTRNLLEAAIRAGAHAVVLSHNHPNGTASFSKADLQSTANIMQSFWTIGVIVLDHILISDKTAVSARQIEKDAPELHDLFSAQSQRDPLILRWFD